MCSQCMPWLLLLLPCFSTQFPYVKTSIFITWSKFNFRISTEYLTPSYFTLDGFILHCNEITCIFIITAVDSEKLNLKHFTSIWFVSALLWLIKLLSYLMCIYEVKNIYRNSTHSFGIQKSTHGIFITVTINVKHGSKS